MTIQVDLTSAPQRRAWESIKPGATVCLPWGRGGGKSTLLRVFCYLLIAQWEHRRRPGARHDGVRIAIVMPTLLQARKVHQILLLSELEGSGEWSWLGARVNRTELRVDFPGGSWLAFVSAEAAQNARGLRCDVVAIDEADDVDAEIVDAVTLPWFSEPHSLRITLVVGTPKRGRYGLLYRTHRRGTPGVAEYIDDHVSVHATCYDFPKFVSPIAVAKAKRETPAPIFEREWLCSFDSSSGLVYPMFSERFHVREPHPGTDFAEVLIGGDHGYEDPGSLVVIGVTGGGRDVVCYAVEEVYAQHKTEQWWIDRAAELHDRYPRARWYFDPSMPARIESYKRLGIRADKTQNAVEDGIASVADMLSIRERDDGHEWAQLYVSPRCENVIREMGLYRRKRDPRNTERVLDDIDTRNDHALDCVRYALHTRFGGPRHRRSDRFDA